MYPGSHAANRPEHPALIMAGSGEVVTYRQLDDRSNQLARFWRERGLAARNLADMKAQNAHVNRYGGNVA